MTEPIDLATKKKRSSAERLFARYKTYEGELGSPEQWRSQAVRTLRLNPEGGLSLLGLTQLPLTIEELRLARREAMLTAHPDKPGGSEERSKSINQAFEKLSKLFPSKTPSVEPVGLVAPPRCTGELPKDLDNPTLIAQVKIDGERFMMYVGFDPYGRRDGNTLLSRHKSTNDGKYVDRSDSARHITEKSYPKQLKTVLDGEILYKDLATTNSIMSSGEGPPVTFFVFDIPFHNGKDIRNLTWKERDKILEEVVREMKNPHIQVLSVLPAGGGEIQRFFERITREGGEGLVVKEINAKYGQSWAKMKKSSDVSCIVTGWRPGAKALEGMVGSLAVSVHRDGNLFEVGFVSGFNNKVREAITADFDSYLGKVMDVCVHTLTKDGKLRDPSFHRFREDVNAEDCTWEKLNADIKIIKSARRKETT